MIDPKNYPRTLYEDNGSENASDIQTIGDIRKLIQDMPDELSVHLICGDGSYELDGEIRTHQCARMDGTRYDLFGLIFHI